MNKHLLSHIIATVFLGLFFFSTPASAAATFTVDNIVYSVSSDSEVSVKSGKACTGNVVIPETVENAGRQYTVTRISGTAFNKNKKITSVTIPGTIKKIPDGDYVWENGRDCPRATFSNCSKLKKVILENGIEKIGNNAFEECTSLRDVILPDTLREIGISSFADAGFSSITIPKSLRKIGQNAFSESNLKSFYLPANVVDTNPSAFTGCKKLESIDVEEGNPDCSSRNGVLYNQDGTELWFYPAGRRNRKFNIPDNVTFIEFFAFYETQYLKTLVIGKACQNLPSCQKCSIAAFKVHKDNSLFTSEDGVIYEKSHRTLLEYPPEKKTKAFFVPEDVSRIEDGAFSTCKYLKEVYICSNVSKLRGSLFDRCSSLERVIFARDSKIKDIPYACFADSTNLKSICLPKSIQSFNDKSGYGSEFLECTNMKTLYIAKGAKVYKQKSFGIQTLSSAFPVIYGHGNKNFLSRLAKSFDLEYVNVDKSQTSILGLTFKDTILHIGVGETKRNPAVIYPTGMKSKQLTYSSSNSKIASVNKKGTVTGISTGICVITVRAADGSKELARCQVKVE